MDGHERCAPALRVCVAAQRHRVLRVTPAAGGPDCAPALCTRARAVATCHRHGPHGGYSAARMCEASRRCATRAAGNAKVSLMRVARRGTHCRGCVWLDGAVHVQLHGACCRALAGEQFSCTCWRALSHGWLFSSLRDVHAQTPLRSFESEALDVTHDFHAEGMGPTTLRRVRCACLPSTFLLELCVPSDRPRHAVAPVRLPGRAVVRVLD